ncbi:hypothetical protein ACTFIR_007487 [Dictyostelium discoideum]
MGLDAITALVFYLPFHMGPIIILFGKLFAFSAIETSLIGVSLALSLAGGIGCAFLLGIMPVLTGYLGRFAPLESNRPRWATLVSSLIANRYVLLLASLFFEEEVVGIENDHEIQPRREIVFTGKAYLVEEYDYRAGLAPAAPWPVQRAISYLSLQLSLRNGVFILS